MDFLSVVSLSSFGGSGVGFKTISATGEEALTDGLLPPGLSDEIGDISSVLNQKQRETFNYRKLG